MRQGSMIIIGLGGTGRTTVVSLSNFVLNYSQFLQESLKQDKWREEAQKYIHMTAIERKHVSIVLGDNILKSHLIMEDINNLLNSAEIPGLFKPEEQNHLIEEFK